VYLGNLPIIGPICSSVSASLSRADASLGGIGHKLASLSNRSSRFVPGGMSIGYGCGVFLGYGFGAGLMLKPQAFESLGDRLKALVPGNLESLSIRSNNDQKVLDGDNSQKTPQLGRKEQTDSNTSTSLQELESKIDALELELSRLGKRISANERLLRNVNNKEDRSTGNSAEDSN